MNNRRTRARTFIKFPGQLFLIDIFSFPIGRKNLLSNLPKIFFMPSKDEFIQAIKTGYTFKGESVQIGAAILDGEVIADAGIFLPLKTMNRHGLIAGATGTGKTKTLQMISEFLSDASVPVLMLDIKGDLSGIAATGASNDKVVDRYQKLKLTYTPAGFPCELLSLTGKNGVHLRATVSEFGPVLLRDRKSVV